MVELQFPLLYTGCQHLFNLFALVNLVEILFLTHLLGI